MGAFPNLSRNVPFCHRLSSMTPLSPFLGPEQGQIGTNEDKTGHFGTNWETPPFSVHPHSALLNFPDVFSTHSLGVHLWKPFLGILGSHLMAISVY